MKLYCLEFSWCEHFLRSMVTTTVRWDAWPAMGGRSSVEIERSNDVEWMAKMYLLECWQTPWASSIRALPGSRLYRNNSVKVHLHHRVCKFYNRSAPGNESWLGLVTKRCLWWELKDGQQQQSPKLSLKSNVQPWNLSMMSPPNSPSLAD